MNSEHLSIKTERNATQKLVVRGLSLNIFYLLKCAKRIRNKLNKLMKSPPIYNKSQHYLIKHACCI